MHSSAWWKIEVACSSETMTHVARRNNAEDLYAYSHRYKNVSCYIHYTCSKIQSTEMYLNQIGMKLQGYIKDFSQKVGLSV